MHPTLMEQLAAERMARMQKAAQAHRVADETNRAAMHAWQLAVAVQALRLARRLDRGGVVVPTALPR